MKKIVLLAVLALLLALAARTRAQDQPRPEGAAPVGSESAPVGSRSPAGLDALLTHQLRGAGGAPGSRDPFETGEGIRRVAVEGHGDRLAPGRGVAIPKLSLRGYVEPKGKAPVALIEVAGQGCYPVRAGDTIGLSASGRTLALRVQLVEAAGVRIETGTLGQVIVVR